MKLDTNAKVHAALDPIRALVAPENRLATIPSRLRVAEAHEAIEKAWAGPEKIRVDLIREYGEADDSGNMRVLPGMPGWDGFATAFSELLALDADVEVTPIPLADIENGYAKDPETGKKGPVDIAGPQLRALIALGIVTDPNAAEKPGPKAVPDESVEGAA